MSGLAVRDFDFTAQGCWQDTVAAAGKVGSAISDGASKAGTWIYNNGSHAVVWLRDVGAGALGWVKERGGNALAWATDGMGGVKDHVFYVGKAIKEGAATGIRWTFDTAYKTYQYAKPHVIAFGAALKQGVVDFYQNARTFVHAHPEGLMGFGIGIIAVFALNGFVHFLR